MGAADDREPLDLDQLSNLLRIATNGPWRRKRNDIEAPDGYTLAITHPRDYSRPRQRVPDLPERMTEEEEANGDLLALSPKLAVEVLALQRECRRLTTELEEQKVLVAKLRDFELKGRRPL